MTICRHLISHCSYCLDSVGICISINDKCSFNVHDNHFSCQLCSAGWLNFFCERYWNFRKLCHVYGPTAMRNGKIRQWCWGFKNYRTNEHDEERSGRPSIQTDDIVEQENRERPNGHHLTISDLADQFPHVGRISISLNNFHITTFVLFTRSGSFVFLCYHGRWNGDILAIPESKIRQCSGAYQLSNYFERKGRHSGWFHGT